MSSDVLMTEPTWFRLRIFVDFEEICHISCGDVNYIDAFLDGWLAASKPASVSRQLSYIEEDDELVIAIFTDNGGYHEDEQVN